MSKELRIFKVMLGLCKEEQHQKDNMENYFDDVICAKEEVNANREEERTLFLLKPLRNRFNFLVVEKNIEEHEPDWDWITNFAEILHREYGWMQNPEEIGESAPGIPNFLELKACRRITPQEGEALLQAMKQDNTWISSQAEYEAFKAECEPYLQEKDKSKEASAIGSRSRRRSARMSREANLSLEEALAGIEELLPGAKNFKEEMHKVVELYKSLQSVGREEQIRNYFPYHYIFFSENDYFELETTLKLMCSIFYNLGIVEQPEYGLLEPYFNPPHRSFDEEDQGGVFAFHLYRDSRERFVNWERLKEEFKEMFYKYEFNKSVLIFVVNKDQKKIEEVQELFHQNLHAYRNIEFEEFTYEQVVMIARSRLAALGFDVSEETEKRLFEAVSSLHEREGCKGLVLVNRLVEEVLSENLESCSGSSPLLPEAGPQPYEISPEFHTEDEAQNGAAVEQPPTETVREVPSGDEIVVNALEKVVKDQTGEQGEGEKRKSAYDELEEMIGLNLVKNRVREMVSHFVMEKKKREAGLEDSPVGMHMRFAGNPGTGKTTVARIIGRILREEGILSKGELMEVSREGLVGAYVGHTALKTAALIEKARGNVLFIDEAYSLYSDTKIDYGNEAVSTLVKYMEDYRDELVVILAGYPDEMEIMMNMNPGLADRVPHKIDFHNYTAHELWQIFHCILGENYVLTSKAEEALQQILQQAIDCAGKDFSNGRFVRNLVERVKLKQSQRLFAQKEQDLSTQKLSNIVKADVEATLSDDDIYGFLKPEGKGIGFGSR